MKAILLISSCLLTLATAISFDLSQLSGSESLFFQSHEPSSNPEANPCDPNKCKLPLCRCSGSDIPGGLQASDTPQMVVLTFQNGIRKEDMPKYTNLFGGRKNPNGCPATGTFFVSHEWTDYFSVQSLYAAGHEIGVNGIVASHTQQWWKDAKESDWIQEMGGEREIISLLSSIPKWNILGERAPYLQMGGDEQLSSILKSGLLYDASRVSVKYATPPNLMWPYTYDYDSTQDCVVPNCPTKSAKGDWQIPLLALKDQSGYPCATLDACNVTTATDVFLLLLRAYWQHNDSNRAPFVLTLSARWVGDNEKLQGTKAFLDYIQRLRETYIVSANRMLQWIWKPTKVSQLSSFQPWQCSQPPPSVCSEQESKTCRYDANRRIVNEVAALFMPTEVKYQTTTCLKICPSCYPWINDTQGTKC